MPDTSGFSEILSEKVPVPKVFNGPLKTVLASDELFLKNSLPNINDGNVLKVVASSFNFSSTTALHSAAGMPVNQFAFICALNGSLSFFNNVWSKTKVDFNLFGLMDSILNDFSKVFAPALILILQVPV